MIEKKLLHYLFFMTLLLASFELFALEIDEKLTLRILRVSNSKKTVLINRGIEDGLVVGDHAKFFITTGVVARGVVIQTAPSRSIWSIYRIVDENEIKDDNVMSLKISSAVKLTPDASKMLTPNIPEVPGAEDKFGDESIAASNFSLEDQNELEMVKGSGDLGPSDRGGISKKSMELSLKLYFPDLSSTSSGSVGSPDDSKSSGLFFVIGAEKYFSDKQSVLHNFSASIFYHSASRVKKDTTREYTYSVQEFGLNINWHFFEDPFAYNSVIPFFTGGIGIGASSTPSADEAKNYKGNTLSYSLGLGVKHFWQNGFGVNSVVDYYIRDEKYLIADGGNYSTKYAGFRCLFGLSYRF